MKAYAIKDPNENLIPDTIRLFENECKRDYTSPDSLEDFWMAESQGFTCVPVTITEVKTDK